MSWTRPSQSQLARRFGIVGMGAAALAIWADLTVPSGIPGIVLLGGSAIYFGALSRRAQPHKVWWQLAVWSGILSLVLLITLWGIGFVLD
jgi:hypothetical protein